MSDELSRKKPKARRTRVFETLPINKGADSAAPRLPQINNPVIIGVLSLGARLVGPLVSNLKPSRRPGRPERFRQRLLRSIQSSPLVAEGERLGALDVRVDVQESFGKPTLVSVDLCLPATAQFTQERLQDPVRGETIRVFLTDLLARLAEALWDNPEIAPVAIRGRVVTLSSRSAETQRQDPSDDPSVLLDMKALGYQDEIARPLDLYDRYGAPASDPRWHP